MGFILRPVKMVSSVSSLAQFKKEREEKTKKVGDSKLPPDEYKPLLPEKDLVLSENAKLVFQTTRGGEFGLPQLDIRLFLTTEVYTGFTKKGFTIPLDKLVDFVNKCLDIVDDAEDLALFSEFDEG